MEGWSDFFFAQSCLSSDLLPLTVRAAQCWLNTTIGNTGSSPLLCMFCKKHRCWKQKWCHVDGTVPRALETLRLASAWCTSADAVNMRTTSKEWYEAFEHTPDETTMARIELKHAEYFARMTALKWVRYWTRPNRMSRSFAPGEPGWNGFSDRSP